MRRDATQEINNTRGKDIKVDEEMHLTGKDWISNKCTED